MAPKLLVVLGATGNQGGSVIKTFLDNEHWKIRGLTRNPSSNAAKALSAKGVQVVSADIDDPSSLLAAFEGAHTIYSITDFWGAYGNQNNKTRAAPGQSMIQWAHDYELQQGKNIIDAAAKIEGLERLVFSALSYATKWSHGKYTKVYHFDSKARAVEYGQNTYPDLWKKASVIQIGFYLSSLLTSPLNQPKKDENGVYVVASKLKGDAKLPIIATEEDTGPCVEALVSVKPGKNLIAYREWLTQEELFHQWGEALGVQAKYVTLPSDTPLNGFPDDMAEDYNDSLAYFAEFGFEGRDDPTVVHPRDLGVPLNLPTVKDWVLKQDWSKVLSE